MVGSTKATFGAGAEVLELTTVDQSRRIVLENLHISSTTEGVKRALELRFGEVIEASLVEGKDHVTALVMLSTTQAAEDAMGFIKLAVPEGLRKAPQKHLLAYSVPEARKHQSSHLSATIEISCHYPSRLAWAHISSAQKAELVANQLHGSKLWGRQLESHYQAPVYSGRFRPPTHTVSISNLPVNVTQTAIEKRLYGESHVMIDPPKYTIQDFERRLPTTLRKHGNLISFEISPVRDGAKKIYAFARFATAKESLATVAQLHGRKLGVLNDSPVYLEIINSIKYSVRYELWPVLEAEVQEALENCNARQSHMNSTVKFAVYQRTNVNQHLRKFRIYSKDVKALGVAKMAIDKIVRGDILSSGEIPIWDSEFETAAGQVRLTCLCASNRCVLSCDPRVRTITLYGEASAREEVKAKIMSHLQSISLRRHCVRFSRAELTWLLSGGFRSLQSQFGEDKIRLDIIGRTLEVIGSKTDAAETQQLLNNSSSAAQVIIGQQSVNDCPVCYCEIENPITFGCGHSYCKACFDHCIASTLRNRLVPLSCIACNTKIDLSILRQLKNFDDLLSISFAIYISQNPTFYSYCLTPDCPQVYRVGPAGTVVQCSECLVHICTFCKIEWHEGLSCSEIQEYHDPEIRKNVGLMKELGIKPCPNCKTLIEKTMGCNHMRCSGCKTHLCWVCMEDFGESGSSAVYNHMSNAHRGWGL